MHFQKVKHIHNLEQELDRLSFL